MMDTSTYLYLSISPECSKHFNTLLPLDPNTPHIGLLLTPPHAQTIVNSSQTPIHPHNLILAWQPEFSPLLALFYITAALLTTQFSPPWTPSLLTNTKHFGTLLPPSTRLCCVTPKRISSLLCQWYATDNQFWCCILGCPTGPQSHRWLLSTQFFLQLCEWRLHAVASSANAKTAGLFYNGQEALPIRYMLEQLGHAQ